MAVLPDESFRDSIATIDVEGNRKYIYPKKPSGKFYDYRKWLSYFLLIILVANPFIKINGNQFMMFNVSERRFNIFSFPFWPQDFYLFVLFMIVGVVFVILFTVIFGRIFCGWICPQTIFLEMVFRRIEYWIEGDRGAQIRLDKQEWNADKIRKKATKWFIFLLISFFIANVFLAYLIGSDVLLHMIKDGPKGHLSTLISLLIFTGVFYFVFAWFREQVCIIACPYGRLQGDCIDCKQCVHVCPTGIDIRNGTQLECINCTACIDECDTIMESVGLPKGLIRYASEDEIEKNEKFKFTTRMKGYSAVLFILVGILSGLLFLRAEIETSILRLPGQLFQHKGNNISNVYTFKIINKSNNEIKDVHFKLKDIKGTLNVVGKQSFVVPRQGMSSGTLFIEINKYLLESDKTKVEIEVYEGDELIQTTATNFLGPRSFD